jgi:hypothetical protein
VQLVEAGLTFAPDALFERPAQLRLVRCANQVGALVVEGGVEEEALVFDDKVLVRLTEAPLPKRDELLALGERGRLPPIL